MTQAPHTQRDSPLPVASPEPRLTEIGAIETGFARRDGG